MVKKIFGMIALAAFIATAAFSAAEAVVPQDTIWVYMNGDTAHAPNCDERNEEICAVEYETFPGTDLPDTSKPTGEVRLGQRIL